MDDFILSHAKSHPVLDAQRRAMISADGSSLLCVEFYGDHVDELKAAHGCGRARSRAGAKPRAMRQVLDPQPQQAIWSFREAALGLSTAMKSRRQGDLVRRRHGGRAGEAARLHRAIRRHRAAAQHHGRRLCARLGRLPARPAGGESQDRGRRRQVRGDRQRGRRSRARIRRRAVRRARRRPGARRLQREDVRVGALPGVPAGEEDLRSERPLQSRPHRRHAADHLAPALRRRLRDAVARDVLRLLGSRTASAAPSRCAAASGCAARSAKARCARRTW